jgi:hypothetical protein
MAIDLIEIVTEYKLIQVRELINGTYHRYVLQPDMDISNQPQQVKDICNVEWNDEIKNKWIAKKQKDSKDRIEELKNKYELKQYQIDRAKNYPSIQEQLDMQYWDKINGTNKWQQAINAVKQKYPK